MEIIEDLRCIGTVADLRLIVGIDDTVVVDILILDIARADCREVLYRTIGDVGLVPEQSDSHQTIGRLQRIACLNEVVISLRLLGHLLDLILIVVEGTSNVEGQIADGLGIVERELNTFAVDLTVIDIRRVETDEGGVGTCTRHTFRLPKRVASIPTLYL